MLFMYLMSCFALIVQIIFLTIAIGAGLYYLAEMVEENTVMSKKIIFWMTNIVLLLFVGLLLFEDIPLPLLVSGILSQIFHHLIICNFPYFEVTSFSFIGAVCLFFVNHYLAFSYFSFTPYSFSEVMAFFTLCLWLIPFSLFVSLSANDNVLPSYASQPKGLGGVEADVVSDYLSKKNKRNGLLGLFHYASEYIRPTRGKKMF
ncbi:hypothetical protein O3M35_004315 [Rhynocoris fuscipes]|uniref:Protein TEX261 n=1 Tax=Rhynocoris fuscipes TaxID=488301 RepID=A0AAW1CFY3_9HEMI